MKEKPLISVIVPVYNVEQYLDRCIKSIIGQTYSNLEIFLIDDGSTDSCGSICDKWALRDPRIKVFHKVNGGLSDARNYGVSRANGCYIAFIDSDDWVTLNYIENLFNAIRKDNADVAVCQLKKVYDDKFECSFNNQLVNYECLSQKECIKRLLYQNKLETSAPTKLFSKKMFKYLNFPVGKLYEDIPVTSSFFLNSDKIAFIENEDYLYYQRSGSIEHVEFNEKKLDAVEHIKAMNSAILLKYPDYVKPCKCRYFSVINNVFMQIGNDKKYSELAESLWKDIVKYRKGVLLDKYARPKARIAAFVSYFGKSALRLTYKKFVK